MLNPRTTLGIKLWRIQMIEKLLFRGVGWRPKSLVLAGCNAAAEAIAVAAETGASANVTSRATVTSENCLASRTWWFSSCHYSRTHYSQSSG